ncbi:helix-turn-helix domain-containing protein [Kitasatospora sp. NBC_00039]|uniref:helix-turn-helix domain-containing protein n=1 Tax=Kitasatospora sp. NBC_00039 TaxID=2903565 RepID=UPI00386CDB5C
MTQRPQSIEAAPAAAGRPRPEEADCPEQFVAVMRRLRQWADLSYRELEKRANAAGHVLPRATLSGALARRDLPREELLTAFVHACGLSGQDAAAWLEARRRLAVATEPLPVRAGGPARETVSIANPASTTALPGAAETDQAGHPVAAAAADGAPPEAAGASPTVPETDPHLSESIPAAESPPPVSAPAPSPVTASGPGGDAGAPGDVTETALSDQRSAGPERAGRGRARPAVIAGLRPRRRAAEDGHDRRQGGRSRRSVVVSAVAVGLVIAAATLAFAPGHRDGLAPSAPATPAPSGAVSSPQSASASPPNTASADSGSAGGSSPASSGPAAPPPTRTSPAATPPPPARTSPAATPPSPSPTKRGSTPPATTDPGPNLPWPGPGPTSTWSTPTPSSSPSPYATFPEDPCGSEARDPCF